MRLPDRVDAVPTTLRGHGEGLAVRRDPAEVLPRSLLQGDVLGLRDARDVRGPLAQARLDDRREAEGLAEHARALHRSEEGARVQGGWAIHGPCVYECLDLSAPPVGERRGVE